MDRLDNMKLFVRVVELGSFAAVAQEMNVSRSVVSRQIQALEAYLGAKLIARSTRRLSLTSAGTPYLEQCREIIRLVDTAESDLGENRRLLRGRIRITLPVSFGISQMMPMFEAFMQDNPEISIELDYNDRRVNLIEGGFDLAIRITNRLAPGDVARKIGYSQVVVTAAPDYIARHGQPQHPEELIQHQCLGHLPTSRSTWEFIINGKVKSFPVAGRLTANNGGALLASAIRGMGIAIFPTVIAEQAVREGRLKILLPGFTSPEMGIYAIFPSNRYVPHRVRALVDSLSGRISVNPIWEEIVQLK